MLKKTNKLRAFIYWRLTFFRDNPWVPEFLVTFIDYIRYELLWSDEFGDI
jgi:hypothetical protein